MVLFLTAAKWMLFDAVVPRVSLAIGGAGGGATILPFINWQAAWAVAITAVAWWAAWLPRGAMVGIPLGVACLVGVYVYVKVYGHPYDRWEEAVPGVRDTLDTLAKERGRKFREKHRKK